MGMGRHELTGHQQTFPRMQQDQFVFVSEILQILLYPAGTGWPPVALSKCPPQRFHSLRITLKQGELGLVPDPMPTAFSCNEQAFLFLLPGYRIASAVAPLAPSTRGPNIKPPKWSLPALKKRHWIPTWTIWSLVIPAHSAPQVHCSYGAVLRRTKEKALMSFHLS